MSVAIPRFLFSQDSNATATQELVRLVSILRLIADPPALNGQRIRVLGFLYAAGIDRGIGLYASETDARNFIEPNAVRLDLGKRTLGREYGRYVILNGKYHLEPAWIISSPTGYIDEISDLKVWDAGDMKK